MTRPKRCRRTYDLVDRKVHPGDLTLLAGGWNPDLGLEERRRAAAVLLTLLAQESGGEFMTVERIMVIAEGIVRDIRTERGVWR